MKVGNLTTLNQDTYPALGKWFVQLWDGDAVVARVYGDTPEQARERAVLLVRQPPEGMTITRANSSNSNSILVRQGRKVVCVDPCDVSDVRELLYSLARVFLPPEVEPEEPVKLAKEDQC